MNTVMALILFGIPVVLGIGLSALALVFDFRKKTQERQLTHTERMTALERGLPLPDADIARAEAEKSRARAAGTIGVLVPVFTLGATIGATALVLEYQRHQEMPFFPSPGSTPALTTIWIVCGVIVTATVILSIRSLRRSSVVDLRGPETPRPVPSSEKPREPVLAEFAPGSAAFKERT